MLKNKTKQKSLQASASNHFDFYGTRWIIGNDCLFLDFEPTCRVTAVFPTPRQQCMRVSPALAPHQHLVFSGFLMLAILWDVTCYLIASCFCWQSNTVVAFSFLTTRGAIVDSRMYKSHACVPLSPAWESPLSQLLAR